MNRRTLAKNLGAVALTSALVRAQQPARTSPNGATGQSAGEVAGIRIVDSSLAKQARTLAFEASPAYLFNHATRTYLFGSLIGKAEKMRFDEELLYLACILHDLGLTDKYAAALPFEIAGAEAAKSFLIKQGLAEPKAEIVWDGIAMHPSAIGSFKRPEIALVGAGAGADVTGGGLNEVTDAQKAEVIAAFPRLGFKQEFVKTCAEFVKRYPGRAGRSFMRDIGERHVPGFRTGNICDAIEKAPFAD